MVSICEQSVTTPTLHRSISSKKQTSETLGTDLITRWETERIINNANMVYINFVYNFSFGKSKSDVKLKMKNEDKDSGILLRNN